MAPMILTDEDIDLYIKKTTLIKQVNNKEFEDDFLMELYSMSGGEYDCFSPSLFLIDVGVKLYHNYFKNRISKHD